MTLKVWFVLLYADKTCEYRSRFQTLRFLQQMGVAETALLTCEFPQSYELESLWDGLVPVIKIPQGSRKWFTKAGLALRILQPRLPADILMMRPFVYWKKTVILRKWLYNQPYVIWLDTYEYVRQKEFWPFIYHELRYGIHLRNADLIVGESPQSAEIASQRLPHNRVIHIPMSVDTVKFASLEAAWNEAGAPPQRSKTILFVARISPEKHPDLLVEAFAQLADEFPDWKLKLVGPVFDKHGENKGVFLSKIKDMIANSGIQERVEIILGLYGEDLYRAYAESSIYALPSEGEGVPSTILEAMYFGGAIVAARSGIVGWMLDEGRCGMLIKMNDLSGLVDGLRHLMGNADQRQSFMQAARSRVERDFSWQTNIQLLIPELQRIARQYRLGS